MPDIRHGQAERFRDRKVDDEIKLGWLLDRAVSGLCAAQNLVHKVRSMPVHVGRVWPIGH